MAGFASQDQILTAQTAGRFYSFPWNKAFPPTTPAVAGEWHCLARGAGNPPADAIFNAGTNLVFQPVLDSTSNAGSIPHGGAVSPYYKFLTSGSAFTAASTANPCVLMLVDIVGFYRLTSVTTTTAQSTTNTLASFSTFTANASTDLLTGAWINLMNLTRVQVSSTTTLPGGLSAATNYYVIKTSDTTIKLATSYANAVAGTAIDITDAGTGTHTLSTLLPRYTDGAGLQAMMWNTNATALGAATPNLSIGYTNSTQTASRATPSVLPIGKTACPNGQILYSGSSGAGKYGPGMPLAAGDQGIAQIDNITCATSYVSGEFSVGLFKPLAVWNLPTIGVSAEKDFIHQFPSGLRIYDGAALYFLVMSGAATPVSSNFYGTLDFTWG